MARYIPITGIGNDFHSLLIDTEVPLDVLHDTAAYRINCRALTHKPSMAAVLYYTLLGLHAASCVPHWIL